MTDGRCPTCGWPRSVTLVDPTPRSVEHAIIAPGFAALPDGARRRGLLSLDLPLRRAAWDGRPVPPLSPAQWTVLLLLARRPGWVMTRDSILDALGDEGERADRAVDHLIKRLRRKLEAAGARGVIGTRRGLGYEWEVGP